MTDPYQVLGVSRSATDDEIKKAYRMLCKRYHPDANVGKPDAAQAEKRFLEVQQAYEEIMHQRQGGTARPGSGYNGGSAQQQQRSSYTYEDPFEQFWRQYGGSTQSDTRRESSPEMQAARNYINSGHFAEALNALGSVPLRERGARWYYLSAMAHSGLHNTAQAMSDARTAVSMEPSNETYQNFLQQLQRGGRGYSQYGEQQYGRHNMGNMSSTCISLVSMYLCCACMGNGAPCMPLFCCL